jgi:hypothetical protein
MSTTNADPAQQQHPATHPNVDARQRADAPAVGKGSTCTASVDPRVKPAARGLFNLADGVPERWDEAYKNAGWERMGRAAVAAIDAADRDQGMVRVSQEMLAAYEQVRGAVEALLDRCDRISPNAVVATSLVRTALTTAQVPDLPTRYPDGGQHD